MRTIIDLTDDQVSKLDARAKAEGRSRAAVVRDMLDRQFAYSKREEYLRTLEAVAGSWRDTFQEDAVDYQNRVRKEWDREL